MTKHIHHVSACSISLSLSTNIVFPLLLQRYSVVRVHSCPSSDPIRLVIDPRWAHGASFRITHRQSVTHDAKDGKCHRLVNCFCLVVVIIIIRIIVQSTETKKRNRTRCKIFSMPIGSNSFRPLLYSAACLRWCHC